MPVKQRRQSRKGHLPVLAERDFLVGLQPLEPHPGGNLVTPFGERDPVRIGKDIAGDMQIAAVIASRQSQLRLRVGRLAAAHHDGADRESRQESRDRSCRAAGSRLPGKEITGARKSEPRRVHQVRRKHVRLFEADHLLAQLNKIGRVTHRRELR